MESWVVFMISGILLSAYSVIFYFYLQKTKLRKTSPQWKSEQPSAKQKEIEEELIQLEHIELDLPTGVCVLPQGASDPSLTEESKMRKD